MGPNLQAVVGGVVAAAAAYWLFWPHIPSNGRRVVYGRPPLPQKGRGGRKSIVAVGTYGIEEALKIIRGYRDANCLDELGGIYVVEFNERNVKSFKRRLRQIRWGLDKRVVYCNPHLLPGGLGNRTVAEVNSKEMRLHWLTGVRESCQDFTDLLRKTEYHTFDLITGSPPHPYSPHTILLLLSPGGHLAIGDEVGRLLKKAFPSADIYLVTILAEMQNQREQLADGLSLIEQGGYARYVIVTDNRRNLPANDQAIATGLASIWQAGRLFENMPDGYNLLRNLYPSHLGGNHVIRLRYFERNLPILHTWTIPILYFFTFWEECVRGVLEGLRALEDPANQGADLPRLPNHNTYVIVTIPLVQDDLKELISYIRKSLEDAGWFGDDPNRSLIFASLAEPMGLGIHRAKMSVMQLEATADGWENLKRLARAKGAVLSGPVKPPAKDHQEDIPEIFQHLDRHTILPEPSKT